MMWLQIAAANLRHSRLTTAVNVVLLALGTASIVLLLLAGAQFERLIARDAEGVDLVVGSKGSPVQLVLSSVYHADVPTGNIPLSDAKQWMDDPRVAEAVPLSLGDSYRGFRIVGTTEHYAELYNATLEQGRFWQAPMQAVIGSAVAERSGLSVGTGFAGAHGLGGGSTHDEQQYRVVGVLKKTGTVMDRLILTSLNSVWKLHDHHGDDEHHDGEEEPEHHDDEEHLGDEAESEHHDDEGHHDGEAEPEHHDDEDHHGGEAESEHHDDEGHHDGEAESEHHDDEDHHGGEAESEHHDDEDHHSDDREITVLLIRYASPMAAISLPRDVNAQSDLQAASPAFEVSRLLQLVGFGLDGLRAFAALLLLTAGFSVFAAMYGALKTRLVDLAMLRSLGATRAELLMSMLLEGLLLSVIGIGLGFVLAHGAMLALAMWLDASRGIGIPGLIWLPQETWLLFALLGIGVIAAALPAWQAYRSDVAKTLASS